MDVVIWGWTPADMATLRTLVESPGIAGQFDVFVGEGALERMFSDPRLPASCVRIATLGGVPVGFGFAFVLSSAHGHWASPRIGVLEAHRRRGIGRRLHDAVVAAAAAAPGVGALVELSSNTWVPDPAAEGFAAALGYGPEHWYWLMERPRGGAPAPVWPEGVERVVFDGGERHLADWNDAYNESFAAHYHFVPSTLEDARAIAAAPGFRADGVLLARRGGRCVGFCRCELHEQRGEVGTLGVVPEARGIGLGRALLRWGVGWLEADNPLPVTLMVDGENENALRLYRSEGFEVTRRRRVWSRRPEGSGA